MIFLQTDVNQYIPDSTLWHNLEMVIIIGVIIYQLYHFVIVYNKISKFKKVFLSKLLLRKGTVTKEKIGSATFDPDEVFTENEEESNNNSLQITNNNKILKLSLVDTNGKNDTILTIRNAINKYLINNYGAAVNFSIIKDIVDREIEVKDDEITQSISLPLYLGLAATMIGIIFGLFSMPELSGKGFSSGINALINGVKIAMFGSLSGLVMTTYLSSFAYKKAKRIVQKDKNSQLTYLQATLLPELIKAEETGVAGLKASLDRFSRVATQITDNVLEATDKTEKNLQLQLEMVEKIDRINVHKVSKWNLELFEKLENNLETLKQFSYYLANMEQIASQLQEFGKRTSDINRVINNIETSLSDSKKLLKFLSIHFEKIENSGASAMKAVGIAESHFEEAISELQKRTESMVENLYKSTGNHEIELNKIYKEIEGNLNNITSQYINAFQEAYSEAIPKFSQLENLELIKEINTTVKNIHFLQQNDVLLNKLNSIEENIKKVQIRNSNTYKPTNTNKDKTSKKPEPITLDKVIKKVF